MHASTHTFAILEVSLEAYTEIRKSLEAAGYRHCFTESKGRSVIDMHGIALATKERLGETVADYRKRTSFPAEKSLVSQTISVRFNTDGGTTK